MKDMLVKRNWPFLKFEWFVKDTCGVFFVLLSEFLLLFAAYVVNYGFIFPRYSKFWVLHFMVFNFLTVLSILSHIACVTTDPGCVPRFCDSAEIEFPENLKSSIPTCTKCNGYKPPRAHHCSVCKRCIIKMDHHCPWINNCVGLNNQKHFILFLLYVFLSAIHALVLISFKLYDCSKFADKLFNDSSIDDKTIAEYSASCNISPSMVFFGLVVCVESLLFGLFALIMIIDQLVCIISDRTSIESLKRTHKDKRSIGSSCTEVFGKTNFYLWPLPLSVRKPFSSVGISKSDFIDLACDNINDSSARWVSNELNSQIASKAIDMDMADCIDFPTFHFPHTLTDSSDEDRLITRSSLNELTSSYKSSHDRLMDAV